MKKIMKFVEEKIVPFLNKITGNVWFDSVAKSVLAIVPFTLVASIITVWNVVRNFITELPDLGILSDFTFGLISLFVVILIPFNIMKNKKKQKKSIVAGFTALCVFLLMSKGVALEDGTMAFNMKHFSAGGMFTAIVIGLFVGFVMYHFSKFSFFKEDSPMPSFVAEWFNSIIPISLCILLGYLIAYNGGIDVFTLIGTLFSPLINIAQSFWGYVIINFLFVLFYSLGVSSWVFEPIHRPVGSWGIAENASLVASGQKAKHIYASGTNNHFRIGGLGATFPLVIMCAFSKSKRYKTMGRVSIVPAIFNINEPIIFGVVAYNPILMIPMWILGIVLPAFTYLWLNSGLATIASEAFGMWYVPSLLNVYLQNQDVRNVLLAFFCLVIAILVWYPFFKIAEKKELEKEKKLVEEKQLKTKAVTE